MATSGLSQVIPPQHVGPLKFRRRETKTRDIQLNEQYEDKEDFAAMTRTKAVNYAQLIRIAGHLCRNAEDLAMSADGCFVDNCRIAGAMLDWAYNLAPPQIVSRFDY